jgi:hypothetical protein
MVFANNRIAILTTRHASDIEAKLRLDKPATDTRRCPRSGGTCPRQSANTRTTTVSRRFWSPRSTSRCSSRLREAVIHHLVNKSAGADLRATKMPIDMMKDIENKSGAALMPCAPYSCQIAASVKPRTRSA